MSVLRFFTVFSFLGFHFLAAEPAIGQRLFWITGDEDLRRAHLDGTGQESLVRSIEIEQPNAITYNGIDGRIYWIDTVVRGVFSARIDGSDIQQLHSTPSSAFGLATNGQLLFWGDSSIRALTRAIVDGSAVEHYFTGQVLPTSLAIHHGQGKIYWSDMLSRTIRRANLDGTEMEDLLRVDFNVFGGITIDEANDRMYWYELVTGRIRSADLDGNNVIEITTGSLPRGLALDAPNRYLYWSEGPVGSRRFRRVNLDNGRVNTVIEGLHGGFGPIAFEFRMHRLYWAASIVQGSIDDPSIGSMKPDGSDNKILISPDRFDLHFVGIDSKEGHMYRVGESNGFTSVDVIIRTDIGNSSPVKSGLIRTRMNRIVIVPEINRAYVTRNNESGGSIIFGLLDEWPTGGGLGFRLGYDPGHWYEGIAADVAGSHLYWADSATGALHRAPLLSGPAEVFLDGLPSPKGVAFDPVRRYLYWVDSESGEVARIHVDSNETEVIYHDALEPLHVAVEPESGNVFWGNAAGQILRNGTIITTGPAPIKGLAIHLGPEILDGIPPPCGVSAAQPHDLFSADGSGGLDSIEVRFSHSVAMTSPEHFTITDWFGKGELPRIVSTVQKSPNRVNIQLDRSVQPGAWTCVVHLPSGTQSCVGLLPGDVDGNRFVDTLEPLRLIDCINGAAYCENWQCDINRSGLCEPSDVLRLIDLLNGADAFDPWLNAALPECP